MLDGITIILLCQLAGELTVVGLALPLPGPVVGMVILLTILLVRGAIPEPIAKAGDGLLANLLLLFVPAGVGIMLHAPLLAQDWVALSASLIGSTLLTIAVTALLMQRLSRVPPSAATATPTEGDSDGTQHR
ncbi:MAG: CidA/LrgA family protein [Hyphomicrobiaceae bacterium]